MSAFQADKGVRGWIVLKGRCPFLGCESLSGLSAGDQWNKAFRTLEGIGTLVFSTIEH